MPMNTMLTRCSGGSTPCSRSTAVICPTISPASRLRLTPSNAVKQNLQFTAHPTWLDTQIVARRELTCGDGARPRPAGRSPATTRSASVPPSISSPASLPSPTLAAISLRHPDRLHRLPVGQFHQIPHRAIARNKLARNRRKPHPPAFLRETSAIFERQRRNLIQPIDLLPIYRIK